MSEDLTVDAGLDEDNPKPKKGQRPKKRPSDFEIIRTILQRTCERKLPIWLRHMGEDENFIVLCSNEEEGFVYGSSSMTLGLVEFDDPEVKAICDGVLSKLYGYNAQHQILINLRDQMSELGKTKGESFGEEPLSDGQGTHWLTRTDVRGGERTVYYSKAVESFFNFDHIREWSGRYGALLRGEDDKALVYPYSHPPGDTSSVLTVGIDDYKDHPIAQFYPHGFRTIVTRGVDLAITKSFEAHFPYPVVKEELLFFLVDGAVCQMAHRVIGTGWRMLLVRPHSVTFPTRDIALTNIGHSGL